MTRYLCISVTFIDPLFHGKGDENVPEWPPSPMRLFQALLAGSRTGCRNHSWSKAKADAFSWLEQSVPPIIVAPSVRLMPSYTLFVPNNDGDVPEKFDRQDRLTAKIAHPHNLCDGDTLHYLWPIDETNDPDVKSHVEVLCQEARNLLALGWGIDQVIGNGRIITDADIPVLPGKRWHPWAGLQTGQRQWRIPKKTSLYDLERIHQSFSERVYGKQYRPSLKLSQFDNVTYIRDSAMPPRPHVVFELSEGISFRQVDTTKVAAMLRSLTCRCSKTDTHEFRVDGQIFDSEVYVAGHVNNAKHTPPRFSYLPLPSIGHEHADGMIRRLLIAEPFGGDGSHARWAQNRLSGSLLIDEDGNERGILLDPWRSSSAMMLRRYADESRTWSTVTPVILPGFDDGKHTKAEKLFFTTVRQAGLPTEAIEEFALRKSLFWPNSQYPSQYHKPAYLKNLPGWHVRLAFREPIRGPLSLGAGRHCGLGLFAAVE